MTETRINPWGVVVPDVLTQPAFMFIAEQDLIEMFLFYVVGADRMLEKHYEEVRDDLISYLRSQQNVFTDALALSLEGEGARTIYSARSYEHLLGQMMYARSVDNFLVYLKDLLLEIFNADPDLFTPEGKEKWDYIWSFRDMTEMKTAITEMKIGDLFRAGIKAISKFFETKLEVKLFQLPEELDTAVLATKYRNLIVHNRGKVDNRFVKEYPTLGWQIGDILTFTYVDISRFNGLTINTMARIDHIVALKFNLERFKNIRSPHLIQERLL